MASRKILIVEDDQSLATLISINLYEAGYEVQVAFDGVLAMAALRDFKPDLVVLDYMFPAGGGAAFYRRLRQLPQTALKPILILSAVEEKEVVKNLPLDSRTLFLAKPYHKQDLIDKIEAMLSSSRPSHDTERLT